MRVLSACVLKGGKEVAFPFENWPYTDLHNLNLDWVLKTMQEAVDAVTKAINGFDSLREAVEKNSEDISALQTSLGSVANRVAELETCCTNVQAAISSINGELETIHTDIVDMGAECKAYTDTEINAVKDALANGELLQVFDPTTGLKGDAQTALDNIAGLIRIDALTAGEYDALELTAEEYDSAELTAYQYDYQGKLLLHKPTSEV